MGARNVFVLLDDARAEGASDAHLFEQPRALFIARRPEDVAATLAAADTALAEQGGALAGYLAYEAGLALEPKLAPLAAARTGADGPLVWLGLFAQHTVIPAADMPRWLADHGQVYPPPAIGPLDPQVSPGGYARQFDALRAAIQAGDIYQANLTFPLAGSYRGDPLALYAAIRPKAAAGYGGVIFDGSHWLLSFSPELFVSLQGASAKAKPMKGTRPRARTPEQDAALASELAHSEKDRAENLMIVDLMRNDLSRVCAPGSVRVDAPFAVETYPTVHQMVSTIRATLLPDMGAMDLVRAIFPCGSITGAPKIRAMELIDETEPRPRGPYCGAIGWIARELASPDAEGTSRAAFNVAIRTLRLTPGEGGSGHAVLGVGSAVVADSQCLPEWRECLVKGDFVRQSAAAACDLIETMHFDPEQGIPLLELHLERLKTSAGELGFVFDRHATRNHIHAVCFELEQPAKIRLVLARSGATALEAGPLPPVSTAPLRCAVLPLPLDPGDTRLRHKTNDRGLYDRALQIARTAGADEALLLRDDGLVTEGSFTNIFVEGDDGVLLTPAARLGLLPGVLRHSLIEAGKAREAELTLDDLAGGFLLGNALRGLMKAELL
ncbi:para-aminobenzoate synthase component I [Caenibius tardaugens NBRC 16725]|uniref:Probable branched-chain-amino-acid aminotransferase n=1 Tax=Caenibius tardaugens NBRC 16725 TaxID=1219035 RepID=U2Y6B8_9SPHN|nr:aminodeoxychorismate synthase component I [Caenibius tardaugens]AZI36197.1 aminodeoxychorismate synthase component I [Caenibius tardaugens NBRC 16725]GAD48706.1 para-aminobenzoate synthase component I [Caenibius tardaugens NBRC 16725]